jgi:hypothetical protein
MDLGETLNGIRGGRSSEKRSSNCFVNGNPEWRQWLDDGGFALVLGAGATGIIRETAVRYGRAAAVCEAPQARRFRLPSAGFLFGMTSTAQLAALGAGSGGARSILAIRS